MSPTKIVVAGEGGLVATNSDDIAEHVRLGRDYGNPGDYDTRFVGLNARLSELHAAVALESLDSVDIHLERRRALAERYRSALATVPGIHTQTIDASDESTFKDLTISIDEASFGLSRDVVARALGAEGVQTRPYFDPPIHRQRSYASASPVTLPKTDEVASQVLSLPMFAELAPDAVDIVVERLAAFRARADDIRAAMTS